VKRFRIDSGFCSHYDVIGFGVMTSWQKDDRLALTITLLAWSWVTLIGWVKLEAKHETIRSGSGAR
jgi:hypothetical protein